jgi:hypothetical protein
MLLSHCSFFHCSVCSGWSCCLLSFINLLPFGPFIFTVLSVLLSQFHHFVSTWTCHFAFRFALRIFFAVSFSSCLYTFAHPAVFILAYRTVRTPRNFQSLHSFSVLRPIFRNLIIFALFECGIFTFLALFWYTLLISSVFRIRMRFCWHLEGQ